MGGRGSGRGAGFGTVAKCEDFNSIDLAWLKRKKLLNAGLSSSIQWSRCGKEIGSIRIQTFDDAVRLIYKQKRSDGEWQPVDERIPLVRTATRFHGDRRWFLCLSCGKRCRILYGGAYFRCRNCHRLKYASQFEAAFDRAASQSHNLRARLGGKGGIDDPLPPKPKGMHWRTYERLVEKNKKLRIAWIRGVAAKFGMDFW